MTASPNLAKPRVTLAAKAVLGWRLAPEGDGGAALTLLAADGTELDLALPEQLLARFVLAAVELLTERQRRVPGGAAVLHPISAWAVEPVLAEPDLRLLTLATQESFALTFLTDRRALEAIARAAAAPAATPSEATH